MENDTDSEDYGHAGHYSKASLRKEEEKRGIKRWLKNLTLVDTRVDIKKGRARARGKLRIEALDLDIPFDIGG
jgi:hypothetical protein